VRRASRRVRLARLRVPCAEGICAEGICAGAGILLETEFRIGSALSRDGRLPGAPLVKPDMSRAADRPRGPASGTTPNTDRRTPPWPSARRAAPSMLSCRTTRTALPHPATLTSEPKTCG
jgi:hypothetical protein